MTRPADQAALDAGAGERRIEGGEHHGGVPRAGEQRIEAAEHHDGVPRAGERRIEGGADRDRGSRDLGVVLEFGVRRPARSLHAACAELLPGYAQASREPWRQSLLTAGCLDGPPTRPAPRKPAPPLIVEDVVQPSDVLCALWLARRSGLFSAGSACGDGVGRHSACEIVPEFAPGVSQRSRDEVWEALRANTAWRAHRAARSAA